MKHLIAALAVCTAVGSAQAQEQLRFASFEPPVAFLTSQVLTPWAEEVSAASNGTLEIQMFPGGTLGRDPAAQLSLVENGVADIAWIVPGYTPGRFEQATVVELPFFVPTAEAGSVAAARMVESGMWSGGGFDDVVVLGMFVTAPGHLVTTEPVNALEDLAGMKLRGAGPVLLSTVEALGGVPVGGIAGPRIAESMSRGVISGSINEWNALRTFRILDVAEHHLALPLGSVALMVVMNRARYEGLPDEARAALDAADGEVFARRFGQMFDAVNAEIAAEAAAQEGRTVVMPSEEEAARWQAATAPAREGWIAANENGQALFDAFQAELDAVAAGG
jgi:TRAP-type C4-dicarboxylate transport system substrate-binding protein